VGAGMSAIARAPEQSSLLRVAIEYPEPNQEIVSPEGRGFVTGKAFQARDALGDFDIYIVIDTSDSTKRPSGADVDGDGLVGEVKRPRLRQVPLLGRFAGTASDDPGDSVLACEIKAAKTLLGQLDSESTRVGIVSFSGDYKRDTPDAVLVAPLTKDYDALASRLDEMLAAGPKGDTNLVEAIQLATLQFERDFMKSRTRKVERLTLLISDGRPTLPLATNATQRLQDTVDAARESKQVNARIYTYAVGDEEAVYFDTLREISKVSGGEFSRVSQPADLIASFQKLDLARIANVTVRNVTTSSVASDVLIDPYGAFAALIKLKDGENVLEVTARSTTGAARTERITVTHRQGAESSPIPGPLLERRGQLIESRLRTLLARQVEREKTERDRNLSISTQ